MKVCRKEVCVDGDGVGGVGLRAASRGADAGLMVDQSLTCGSHGVGTLVEEMVLVRVIVG